MDLPLTDIIVPLTYFCLIVNKQFIKLHAFSNHGI
jgi:hypothetical protein